MSAIAGLVYFDGRSDREGVVTKMMETMAHRGPDGRRAAALGSATFAHLLLRASLEPEGLPLQDPFLFTADSRLDNRECLLKTLRLDSASPDSKLTLVAFQKWGADAPKFLAGDFAFALWDQSEQSLFCARDHIGVRPFYYFHKPGEFFIFATQIRALFCHPAVPRRLNKERFNQALLGLHTDQASTFYEGIHRLPAAHTLRVARDGFNLCRYWALDPNAEATFASDSEAIEAFREHFTRAVQSRLRTPRKIAVELSGGLDSSAVACVARDLLRAENRLPLPAYSAVFPSVPASDETPFIDAVLAQGGFEPVLVRGDEAGPLSAFETFLAYEDEGAFGTNLFIIDAMRRAMRRDGVRVFLNGFDGDTAVGHGNFRLAELAAARRWDEFDRELAALATRQNLSRAVAADAYAAPALVRAFASQSLGASLRFARQAAPHFGQNWARLAAKTALRRSPGWTRNALRHVKGEPKRGIDLLPGLLNPDLARTLNIPKALASAHTQPEPDLTEGARLARLVQSGSFSFGLERYDYHAGFSGMESRHPFTDLRLIEFCAALPSRFRLADGFNRWIMRKALETVLPPEIAWRPGKGNLNHNFAAGFFQRDAAIVEAWLAKQTTALQALVNVPAARELFLELKDSRRPDHPTVHTLFRLLTSARWLAHSNLRPA